MKNKSIKFISILALVLVQIFICNSNNISYGKEKKVDELKIIQISDIHIDTKSRDRKGRLYTKSLELFENAVKQVNNIEDVDAVVFSGDLINRPNKIDLYKFTKTANKLEAPWLPSLGNHDINPVFGELNKNEYMITISSHNYDINSTNSYYFYIPQKGYIIIMLDGVMEKSITANGHFDNIQLEWLDKTLSKYKNHKAILVQHFPVVEPYKSLSHKVLNDEEYLELIQKHPNVIAILSGHYHAAKAQKVDGILHISTPALVEYPNAFRVLTFKDNGEKIEIQSKMIETELQDIQKESKEKAGSPELNYGSIEDRNFIMYVDDKTPKPFWKK